MRMNHKKISIIGIDCATDAKNVGLSHGYIDNGLLIIDKMTKPDAKQAVVDAIMPWISQNETVLLAIDAPLGWPRNLGEQLFDHSAGDHIKVEPNSLFRRYTDLFIKQQVGKQSLDVGADRIARTAHAALNILSAIGERAGYPIPMAWDPVINSPISAIEVYPAATLKQSKCLHQGYKKKENTLQRRQICDFLIRDITFTTDTSVMLIDDDILDASVCVLSGYYFIKNLCMPPEDDELARKEGWIWVRK